MPKPCLQGLFEDRDGVGGYYLAAQGSVINLTTLAVRGPVTPHRAAQRKGSGAGPTTRVRPQQSGRTHHMSD